MSRYCTNCGAELPEDARFCGSCGRPARQTAAVSTPEADVRVPTPPAPTVRERPGFNMGALTVMALALLAVFITAASAGASSVGPSQSAAFALGVGTASGAIVAALPATLVLLVAAIYWLTARKDGVVFTEALFNWPMAILTGGIALFGFLI